jgi:hypothetical protein
MLKLITTKEIKCATIDNGKLEFTIAQRPQNASSFSTLS